MHCDPLVMMCPNRRSGAEEIVIKAQIHAGGRGKGHFSNGFQSGVHLTKEYAGFFHLSFLSISHFLKPA
jgi:succinyl-CoA synthetase beta subunit